MYKKKEGYNKVLVHNMSSELDNALQVRVVNYVNKTLILICDFRTCFIWKVSYSENFTTWYVNIKTRYFFPLIFKRSFTNDIIKKKYKVDYLADNTVQKFLAAVY